LECNHVLAECHFPQYRGRHQLGIPGHWISRKKQDANSSSTTQYAGLLVSCMIQGRMTGSGKTFHACILHSHKQLLSTALLKYTAGRTQSVKRQDRGFDSRLYRDKHRKSSWQKSNLGPSFSFRCF
jgi:hypothetical protein